MKTAPQNLLALAVAVVVFLLPAGDVRGVCVESKTLVRVEVVIVPESCRPATDDFAPHWEVHRRSGTEEMVKNITKGTEMADIEWWRQQDMAQWPGLLVQATTVKAWKKLRRHADRPFNRIRKPPSVRRIRTFYLPDARACKELPARLLGLLDTLCCDSGPSQFGCPSEPEERLLRLKEIEPAGPVE